MQLMLSFYVAIVVVQNYLILLQRYNTTDALTSFREQANKLPQSSQ